MEFGLHLPNAGPFANGPDIVRTAQCAEELGFHSVWLFDHLFTPSKLESKYPYSPHPDGRPIWTPETPWPDSWVLMGALIGVTERLHFTTNIYVAPNRPILQVAKQVLPVYAHAAPLGIRAPGPRGNHYLIYSFAKGERVGNAFLESLVGLWDYWQISEDKRARSLFVKAYVRALITSWACWSSISHTLAHSSRLSVR